MYEVAEECESDEEESHDEIAEKLFLTPTYC